MTDVFDKVFSEKLSAIIVLGTERNVYGWR